MPTFHSFGETIPSTLTMGNAHLLHKIFAAFCRIAAANHSNLRFAAANFECGKNRSYNQKHCGVMDKASDNGPDGPGFKPRANFVSSFKPELCSKTSSYLR